MRYKFQKRITVTCKKVKKEEGTKRIVVHRSHCCMLWYHLCACPLLPFSFHSSLSSFPICPLLFPSSIFSPARYDCLPSPVNATRGTIPPPACYATELILCTISTAGFCRAGFTTLPTCAVQKETIAIPYIYVGM